MGDERGHQPAHFTYRLCYDTIRIQILKVSESCRTRKMELRSGSNPAPNPAAFRVVRGLRSGSKPGPQAGNPEPLLTLGSNAGSDLQSISVTHTCSKLSLQTIYQSTRGTIVPRFFQRGYFTQIRYHDNEVLLPHNEGNKCQLPLSYSHQLTISSTVYFLKGGSCTIFKGKLEVVLQFDFCGNAQEFTHVLGHHLDTGYLDY